MQISLQTAKIPYQMHTCFLYKQLLSKQGSTQQDKNLSNSCTAYRNAKQFENFSSDPIGNENQL